MLVLRLLSWTLDIVEFLVSPLGLIAIGVAIVYGMNLLVPELETRSGNLFVLLGLVYLYCFLDE